MAFLAATATGALTKKATLARVKKHYLARFGSVVTLKKAEIPQKHRGAARSKRPRGVLRFAQDAVPLGWDRFVSAEGFSFAAAGTSGLSKSGILSFSEASLRTGFALEYPTGQVSPREDFVWNFCLPFI